MPLLTANTYPLPQSARNLDTEPEALAPGVPIHTKLDTEPEALAPGSLPTTP